MPTQEELDMIAALKKKMEYGSAKRCGTCAHSAYDKQDYSGSSCPGIICHANAAIPFSVDHDNCCKLHKAK